MGKTILAIDDSKKILDIIKYFLEQEGYSVKAVQDPKEGLKVAREGGVDLILLDIMMPGMDGYTVFDRLKKDPATQEIPVVMLTAKAIILHTPKDFFFGLYGFLAKPFSKQQLLKVVGEALRVTREAQDQEGLTGEEPGSERSEPEAPSPLP
ncbi:MAG: two-component system response regulator [Planctomycetota bacterium]